MSGPGSDVSAELGDYLEQKGVNALFLELVEYLLAERPSNPVQFVLSHLVTHYPDMCQIPRVIGFETEEGTARARGCVLGRGTPGHVGVCTPRCAVPVHRQRQC